MRLVSPAAKELEQYVHTCLKLEPKDEVKAYGHGERIYELGFWCPIGPGEKKGSGGAWMHMDGLFDREVSHVLYCAQSFIDHHDIKDSPDESEQSDWRAIKEQLAKALKGES